MSKLFYEALGPVEAHKAFAGTTTRLTTITTADYEPAFGPEHPDAPASFDIPGEPAGKVETPYGH
jgi:hypothetical protein